MRIIYILDDSIIKFIISLSKALGNCCDYQNLSEKGIISVS